MLVPLTFLFMPIVFWLAFFFFSSNSHDYCSLLLFIALPPDISFPTSPVRNHGITTDNAVSSLKCCIMSSQ